MSSDAEDERQPSEIKIFVDNCDQYAGSAIATFLASEGYSVYGYGKAAPHPSVVLLDSRKEGILTTELCVFDMMRDPESVAEALNIVNSNPLHHKIKMAIFSPLLTWGGRSTHPEEEETHIEEEEAKEEPKEENQEEEDQETEPFQPVNEEEYLNRVPHELVREQYRLESRALQLNEEIERLDVFIFATGILYGLGERVFFPFFRQLWEGKTDTFPSSKAHLSLMHVKNLGIAVKQLLDIQEEDEEQKHYFILAEQNTPTLREIGKAFSSVLADGKVGNIPDYVDSFELALLTTELAAESTFLGDAELHCQEGIIECAAQVVDEFRSKYRLEPLKVLVIGPPASGVEPTAQMISQKIGAPLIEPHTLLEEAKKEVSEFGDEIRSTIEEEEGVISDELICKVTHRRMAKRDCRNYGWVMSGFADTYDKASLIFDDGEEEPASPHFSHLPTHVVIIEESDDILRARAAEKADDSAEFEKRLKEYRKSQQGTYDPEQPDEETHNIYSFYDDRSIPSVIIEDIDSLEDTVTSFIGPKRDFGRSREEIEAEIAAVKRAQEEAQEREKQRKEASLKVETEKWSQGDEIHDLSVQRLKAEDDDFLATKARELENFVDEKLMQHILDGILDVAHKMPEDPVDSLAEFLFARHRQLKKQ